MAPHPPKVRRAATIVRLAALALVVAAPSAPAPLAVDPVAIEITVDRAGTGTRLVLTHARAVDHVVQQTDGRIEVVYAEPIEVKPERGRFEDDPLLDRYVTRGGRSVVLFTGAQFRAYETFELNQPFRLVLDLEGGVASGEVGAGPPAAAPRAVIVLDPGHGGVEHGAVGPTGLREKEVTLHLAQLLKRALEQQDPSLAVVLTRDDDRLIGLDERTAIANYNKADLFVSIHLNASPRPEATGAETYYLASDATDGEARRLAALENRAWDGDDTQLARRGTGDPLDLVLWDLAQNHHLAESAALAESLQGYFNVLTGTRDRGVRQAPFRVLMGATMPAVLVEAGFISNPDEEQKFKTLGYRQQVVQAMSFAVADYLQKLERYASPRARALGPR
jgi:N-acetylmuramoyl-L-alanine amidase